MSLINLKKMTQRGDTIVEVMLVLAVLGLAISISYATANRSLLQAREAQENSVATELLQSQIERIRSQGVAFLANPPAVDFCIDPTTNAVTPSPAPCLQGTNNMYHIIVRYCPTNPSPECPGHPVHAADNTYLATAIWDSVSGEGQDKVTITYRVR